MNIGKRINIVQYGLGQVGQALLRQILAGRQQLATRSGLELRHIALADSRGFLADTAGLADEQLQAALEGKTQGGAIDRLPGAQAHTAGPAPLPNAHDATVLVDVTAAEGMDALAQAALSRGWGVALANKRPLCGPMATFHALAGRRRLRCEATVGAGLPWIEALTHLLNTGDRVLQLEAAVSGTLGFIASRLEQGTPFSAAVREARALGYTEPDPRDDLSAADVRRKGLILARLLGHSLEWEDLPAEALYPAEWGALDVDGFMARLPELDESMAGRMHNALAAGRTLRYSIAIDGTGCRAGLREVDRDSPLGRLQGPDCLLAVRTERYNPQPLVISGPGAGAEVTAAGVYADILSLGMEF